MPDALRKEIREARVEPSQVVPPSYLEEDAGIR